MDKVILWKRASHALLCVATVIASPAQTLTTLYRFCAQTNCTDGSEPLAGLVQATDGNFYGTTWLGGANGDGTIFKITPGHTLTTLYSFCSIPSCADGANPRGSLIQATDGNLYGTTESGGDLSCPNPFGCGTVFRITPQGVLTTLHVFAGLIGGGPTAGLVQATDGNLYGTTVQGGNGEYCAGTSGCGTVFKITLGGALITLYSFCQLPNCSDGSDPDDTLIQAANGFLYGTTSSTIFNITLGGKLTRLHIFNKHDGRAPEAALIQATGGDFYGTTSSGEETLHEGTLFQFAQGTLTVLDNFSLHSYCGPGNAGVIQATDGNLYGTTSCNIYTATTSGAFTLLYDFRSAGFSGGLIQGTDGTFYGIGAAGATNGAGFVFNLSTGLGPFIITRPASGKVGAEVSILGTNLTGVTSVTFNGTVAAFNVVSPNLITTTVPTGATTGTVQVVTPSGTLSSNGPFRVH